MNLGNEPGIIQIGSNQLYLRFECLYIPFNYQFTLGNNCGAATKMTAFRAKWNVNVEGNIFRLLLVGLLQLADIIRCSKTLIEKIGRRIAGVSRSGYVVFV